MQENINQFKIVDKAFKTNHSNKYDLCVRMSDTELSYCIFDPNKNKLVALANYSDVQAYLHNQLFVSDELLKLPYSKVTVLLSAPAYTLLPSEYFEMSNIQDYANVLLGEGQGNLMLNDIKSIGAKSLFRVSPTQQLAVDQLLKGASIVDEGTVLVESIFNQYGTSNKDMLFIQADDKYVHITLLRNKLLIFYNRFEYVTDEEFIYYPLLICNRLNVHIDTLRVFMSGTIRPKQSNFILIHQHFRHVKFIEINSSILFSSKLSDIPQHYFYTLINAGLCV